MELKRHAVWMLAVATAVVMLFAGCGGGSGGRNNTGAAAAMGGADDSPLAPLEGPSEADVEENILDTENAAPIADAGEDQRFSQAGAEILLDGNRSYDPDEDLITYQWVLTGRPEASTAELTGADTISPSFIADRLGTYTIELVVIDNFDNSSLPDQVVITSDNVAPVADAGGDQVVPAGQIVWLDGSRSHDADGDELTYQWDLSTKPKGSKALLYDADQVDPTFVPDQQGAYVFSLVVSDGLADSEPDAVTILALDSAFINDDFISLLIEAVNAINGLPDDAFANRNHRKALVNKIMAIIRTYIGEDFDPESIVDKLIDDIGAKMDGNPRDWIRDPDAQEVYSLILLAAESLQN